MISDEEVLKNFSSFPDLYRRIKISNIQNLDLRTVP